MLTTDAGSPRARAACAKRCMVKNGPRAFVSMSRAQISGVVSRSPPRSQAAAALTSAFAPPIASAASTSAKQSSTRARSAATKRASTPSARAAASPFRRVAARQHQPRASLGREPPGDGEAQPLGAAGDDGTGRGVPRRRGHAAS